VHSWIEEAPPPVGSELTLAYTLSPGLLAILLLVSSVAGLLYGRGGFCDDRSRGE
jgi:hypothetical protein